MKQKLLILRVVGKMLIIGIRDTLVVVFFLNSNVINRLRFDFTVPRHMRSIRKRFEKWRANSKMTIKLIKMSNTIVFIII